MLWSGLFGKSHQETPLFLHLLLTYPPAKTAIDLSSQPRRVILVWCAHWTQSFNSPVAHLLDVLVGVLDVLVKASSFLFQQKTQQGSSKVPQAHGPSSTFSLRVWQSPASHPAPSQTGPKHQHLFLTATGTGQQLLHGSLIPFPPFGGASPELNICLLPLSTTSPVVSKNLWWILQSKSLLFYHDKSMSANDRRPPLTPVHQSV